MKIKLQQLNIQTIILLFNFLQKEVKIRNLILIKLSYRLGKTLDLKECFRNQPITKISFTHSTTVKV